MAKSARATRTRPPDHEPIRIVPLHRPPEIKPAIPALAAPHLTYRGGPLITAVEVFTIFWGSAWNEAPQLLIVDQVNAFFDFVLTSSLIDQLAEYSVAKYAIAHGKRTGTVTIAAGTIPPSVTDRAIQSFLDQQVRAKTVPAPTANTLLFVYVEPGIRVVMGGSASCQAFCGYHSAAASGLLYAVMPYPDCSGCTGTLTPFEAVTATSSHELCEAITDPIPGQGWYDDANGEIGDICAWQTKQVGTYTVQQEWSNRESRCV